MRSNTAVRPVEMQCRTSASASAITTLTKAVPLVRQEARAIVDRLTEVAAAITAATELVSDPAALDAHLRRIQVDADKVRADLEAAQAEAAAVHA